MVLYSCDHGQTTIDNYDERFVDEERELIAEIVDDIDNDYDQQAWSGMSWDFWESTGGYQRPNIFA